MLTAQIELLSGALPEAMHLLEGHYEELSLHREHGFPLVPQYELYLERERSGMTVCATLRLDGKIVGYKVGFVNSGLHYATCLTASPDLFYIAPEFRGGVGALKLFRCYERELRRRGVHLWFDAIKSTKGVPNTDRLFTAFGFVETERTFSKWLV